MGGSKYKAVIFDFGGVVQVNDAGNILERIADLINVPLPEFKKAYFERNHLMNVHNMPFEDVAMEAVRVFDKSLETEMRVRNTIRDHKKSHRLNTDLLSMFSALREQGLKVAILSNGTTDRRKWLEENGIARLVDEIVISAEIGHQKPHKEAFDVIFKKLSVLPEEAIFVDDTPKSLEKASEIGYFPILFENNNQLMDDLKGVGIEV